MNPRIILYKAGNYSLSFDETFLTHQFGYTADNFFEHTFMQMIE